MHNLFFLEATWIIWNLGKCVVAYSGAMMIIICFYYAFVEKEGYAFQTTKWKEEMKLKCLEMYLYIVCSYLIMTISVVYSAQSFLVAQVSKKMPVYVVIGSASMMTALTVILENVSEFPDYKYFKIICWALLSISMGPCLAFFGNEINVKSGMTTACAVVLANCMALTAHTKLYERIKIRVVWFYMIVCLANALCLVNGPPFHVVRAVWASINIFGGILAYFCVYVTNIQYTIQDMEYNEVNVLHSAAISFISSMNLFVRVALFLVIEDTWWLHSTISNS